jgi:hypothetical protein
MSTSRWTNIQFYIWIYINWNRGFEFRFGHGYIPVFSCVAVICIGRYSPCDQQIPFAPRRSTYQIWLFKDAVSNETMINEYEAISGMGTGRGNRSSRRKPDPVTFCPPQIPYDLTWDRTRAAVTRSLRPTAWTTTRPHYTKWFVISELILNQNRTEDLIRDINSWKTSHNPTHC